MICWSLCAFIWFRNIEKMLLQMTSCFLQLESTISRNETVPTQPDFFLNFGLGYFEVIQLVLLPNPKKILIFFTYYRLFI
jgi:hypothetical protein